MLLGSGWASPERRVRPLASSLSIGSNSVVGAGSVVTKDVPDNCLVLGVPAKLIRTGIPGFGDQSVS